MDTLSTEDSITKSAELISKRKRKRARKRANGKEKRQRLDQMLKNLEASTTTLSEKSPVKKKGWTKRMKALNKKVDPTLSEKSPVKKKRWTKRMKALNKKVDPCNLNNVPSNRSLLDNKCGEVENGILNPNISIDDVASLEDSDAQMLPLGHLEIQTESTITLSEKSPVKKKRWTKRMKALNKKVDPALSEKSPVKKKRWTKRMKALNKKVDPCNLNNVPSNPSLLDKKYGEVENGLLNPNISVKDVASLDNSDAQLLPVGHLEIQTEGATTLLEKSPVKRKRKRKKKRSLKKALNKEFDPGSMDQNNVPSNNQLGEVENGLLNPNISIEDVASLENSDAQLLPLGPKGDDVKVANGAMEGEVSLFEAGRISAESSSERTRFTHNSELIMHVHAAPTRPGDFCMMKGPCLRRKLLILDVNGLLADVVNPPPKDCNPDTCFWRRAIFKRPYCNDFLRFCFERFDVGIWSSRSKKIVVKVVDYLLGNLKHKLLFCWDMSHSTQTMFKTLENQHKPLVCKELSKVWDRYDPNLPWERGDYDESNTLLLDDSPYKALLNPAHTAIFPHSYTFKAENDNSLGPGGDLRIYLEELLKAEHVQKYVEQHPFGQPAIDQTSSEWNFYSDVLCSLRGQSG